MTHPASPLSALPMQASPFLRVLEEMRDGVLVCDTALRVLMCNNAFRSLMGLSGTGHPVDPLLPSTSCRALIPSEELLALMQSVMASGQSFDQEFSLPFGGVERVFHIHGMPLLLDAPAEGAQPVVTGCVAIFYDQTAIFKTEKMRRDFVANVSHELRTPLSAIKGYAETLLDGALEDQSVALDFINVIYKHSNRLTQLVEDLLDLSKLESSDFRPELEPTPLLPVIRHIETLIAGNLQAKELSFEIDAPDELPLVLVNVGNLEQVLTNLIDNAIKYTPVGGRIAVSVLRSPQGKHRVQVNIADTGIGIEAKHIHRLFERFYRIDKARSRDLGGTGLGLSIVKHIIQLHGGEIWVESHAGQGSTFSFTLQAAV